MAKAFGHLLEDLTDGVTVFREGVGKPMPLTCTSFDIDITAGLATVVATRTFSNQEDVPIEAILTMPVGFNAVVTGLSATIDGRVLRAAAKPKSDAREDYEAAIDEGKMAVLHEEALRGIHVLSVGQLAPGKVVSVELRTVLPLSATGGDPLLRIPVTTGQLYGASPLQLADDLITDATITHRATLSVRTDAGPAILSGTGPVGPAGEMEITLDRAIEISVPGARFGTRLGVSGEGHQVRVDLRPQASGERPLRLAVLVDRSGSTAYPIPDTGERILSAMRRGLIQSLSTLAETDQVAIWQFSSSCNRLGTARGPQAAELLDRLGLPEGGTNLADAITTVAESGVEDILVLTDGQTWDAIPRLASMLKARISAVLVGRNSLDAQIGHLVSMTGGDLFYAPGADVAGCVRLALESTRSTTALRSIEMRDGRPHRVTRSMGGIQITAEWSEAMEVGGATDMGRFAAGLSLGLMSENETVELAVRECLCTHATSLVLVDEAGAISPGLSETRKVPLSIHESIRRSQLAPRGSSSGKVPRAYDHPGVMHSERAPRGSDTGIYRMVEQAAVVASPIREKPRFLLREARSNDTVDWVKWEQNSGARSAFKAIWPDRIVLDFLDDDPVVQKWIARARQGSRDHLKRVARSVDWDGQANRFLAGDYSGLSSDQLDTLLAMEMQLKLQELATQAGIPLRTLLLAYLAIRFADSLRPAARFAKKVLATAPGLSSLTLPEIDAVVFPWQARTIASVSEGATGS
jgi:hypothetical protein